MSKISLTDRIQLTVLGGGPQHFDLLVRVTVQDFIHLMIESLI